MRWLMVVAVGLGLLCASRVVSAQGAVKEEKVKRRMVPVHEIPASVKAAIRKEATKYFVTSVVLVTYGDKKRYEAEWTAKDKKIEIILDAEGKVTEREVVVPMGSVPWIAADAITKAAGDNKFEVKKVAAGERKLYEARWTVNGRRVEIRFDTDGRAVRKEVEE